MLGVAWLRLASAALIFALWRRPWCKFAQLDRSGQVLIIGLGAVFALMNVCFYESIDRLLLATVAAIEFIGPIVLAVIGARIPRNFAAVLAAAGGVYLLTHVRFVGQPVGVAFALANAILFTAYIVLAHRVARRSEMGGIDGLATAMMFAFVFVSPIRAAGRIAAGDRDRDRRDRALPAALPARPGRDCAGDDRGGPPSLRGPWIEWCYLRRSVSITWYGSVSSRFTSSRSNRGNHRSRM